MLMSLNFNSNCGRNTEIVILNCNLNITFADECNCAVCPVFSIVSDICRNRIILVKVGYTHCESIRNKFNAVINEAEDVAKGISLVIFKTINLALKLFNRCTFFSIKNSNTCEVSNSLSSHPPTVAGYEVVELEVNVLLIFLEVCYTVFVFVDVLFTVFAVMIACIFMIPNRAILKVIAGRVFGAVTLRIVNDNVVCSAACGNGAGCVVKISNSSAVNSLDLGQTAHLIVVSIGSRGIIYNLTIVIIIPSTKVNGTILCSDAIHLGVGVTVHCHVLANRTDQHTGITVRVVLIVSANVVINVHLRGNVAVFEVNTTVSRLIRR